jgi:parallel beta-helix repeat protein
MEDLDFKMEKHLIKYFGLMFIIITLNLIGICMIILSTNVSAININNCTILNESNSTYYLTANIINSNVTYCMNITANNVTLNCNGNIIDGVDKIIPITSSGIYLKSIQNNTIMNCLINDFNYGIYLSSSLNNNVINNKLTSNTNVGIYLSSTSNNNKILDNIFNSNYYGFGIATSSNNNFTNNNITSNSYRGFSLFSASNNNINYNFFNNTNTTDFSGINYYNNWNYNFWANLNNSGYSQVCTNSDGDNFCDLPFILKENNTDFYPLTNIITQMSYLSYNYFINNADSSTTENSVVTFSVSLFDNEGLRSYQISSNEMGIYYNQSKMILSGEDGILSYNLTFDLIASQPEYTPICAIVYFSDKYGSIYTYPSCFVVNKSYENRNNFIILLFLILAIILIFMSFIFAIPVFSLIGGIIFIFLGGNYIIINWVYGIILIVLGIASIAMTIAIMRQ